MALRVSIGMALTRFCTTSKETTWAAFANAAFVAASSPSAQSKERLLAAPSQICAPLGAEASVPEASSVSYST
jgi:hypothetical protein